MKKIWILAFRDFRAYFTSPIAYIVIALFLFIMGWFFINNMFFFMQMAQSGSPYQRGPTPSITDGIIRPLYSNMNLVLLFLTPFITMRLMAEERKMHTLELLMTSPLSVTQIVLGKFLSAFLLLLCMVLPTMTYPVILSVAGNPDWGPVFTSIVGTLLMASCYLSMGLLFSTMTENQIIAGVLTIATSLFFWLVNWASHSAGPGLAGLLDYLSLIKHLNNFLRGVLDTSDVVYYLSFIFTGLFLTYRAIDSYRWRS